MGVLRANQAFSYDDHNGVPRTVRPGDLYDEDDPDVKGREALFEPVETALSRRRNSGVEEATAAPGEKRSVTPPRTGSRRSQAPAQ